MILICENQRKVIYDAMIEVFTIQSYSPTKISLYLSVSSISFSIHTFLLKGKFRDAGKVLKSMKEIQDTPAMVPSRFFIFFLP